MSANTIEEPCELCTATGRDAGQFNLSRECCWVRFLTPEVKKRSSNMPAWMEEIRALFPPEVAEKIRNELKKEVVA